MSPPAALLDAFITTQIILLYKSPMNVSSQEEARIYCELAKPPAPESATGQRFPIEGRRPAPHSATRSPE